MATAPENPTEPPEPPSRRKKRWIIPLILIGLIIIFSIWVCIRGSWADATVKNPSTSADGIITYLHQTADGHKQVRSAVVIDAPPAEVWAVVTDYPNHNKIFHYVSKIEANKEADGRYHLQGVAHSRLWGDWPYEAHVKHEQTPDKGSYRAWWDEPSEDITVNRGSWQIQPTPDGKTLLVYTLEVEVGRYPTFLIRNLLLDRLGTVVAEVQEAVRQRHSAP
jgi:uncharacterized membrane protein